MKPALYIETSVVSYLTARLSRDLITAARQQITETWWRTQRSAYDLLVSPLVMEEARAGNAEAAAARLVALSEIPIIKPLPEANVLVERLLSDIPLPEEAAADAAHIALATTAGAEYLLTWNFKHIANPVLREQIRAVCRRSGYEPPIICTPEDLLGGASP